MSKFVDLAETESYLLWMEVEEGQDITLAMVDRGVTVALTPEDLDELVGALTKARDEVRKLGRPADEGPPW